ncbi:hypothetical protein ACP4OV_001993 [Aristida adscensionis]
MDGGGGGGRKKTRLDDGGGGRKEEIERVVDISSLPDAVLGDNVSCLPTKDGARTQLLSRTWPPLWRSAPLNLNASVSDWPPRRRHLLHPLCASGPRPPLLHPREVFERRRPPHRDPGRLALVSRPGQPPGARDLRWQLAQAVAASAAAAAGVDNGDGGMPPRLPLLQRLTLEDVAISESTLHALLAGCPAMEILLLCYITGCSHARIPSSSLRSIGVRFCDELELKQLTIEDAPCLERLLFFGARGDDINISVISAPKLATLGKVYADSPRLQLGTTIFQGSRSVDLATAVRSVKVLAVKCVNMDMVINFIKCFPCLEKLYIKHLTEKETNAWCRKYRHLIGTLEIHLRKIVLMHYRGNKSHVNFVKFLLLNARSLESMILGLERLEKLTDVAWIERQHRLLQIEKRAAKGALFDFVKHGTMSGLSYEVALDLSTADPFEGLR